jgi:hypothetical protein
MPPSLMQCISWHSHILLVGACFEMGGCVSCAVSFVCLPIASAMLLYQYWPPGMLAYRQSGKLLTLRCVL